MKKQEFVTVKQAAEILGLCVDSVRKYCQQSRIAGASVINGAWAIPLKSLKKGIEKQKVGRKKKEIQK